MTLLTDVDYRQHKQGTAILPLWHLPKQTYYALYYSDWCFFTNVSFVNATLKYSKCVNYCNLWCKPQELPCPETSRLNRLHQQLINKHVASLDRVIQGYAAYGFRHLFRHSLKVTAVFRIDWYLQWQSQMLPFVLLDYPFFIHMFR